MCVHKQIALSLLPGRLRGGHYVRSRAILLSIQPSENHLVGWCSRSNLCKLATGMRFFYSWLPVMKSKWRLDSPTRVKTMIKNHFSHWANIVISVISPHVYSTLRKRVIVFYVSTLRTNRETLAGKPFTGDFFRGCSGFSRYLKQPVCFNVLQYRMGSWIP